MSNTDVAERQANPISELRSQVENLEGQFKAALPAHIPVERFCRVLMTAIQNNPDLVVKVERRSLFNAAMKAAQDGLLPDGRDGAIVVYGSQAQWMPMIGGLRKKVRNSGEIATWDAQIVHKNDKFQFRLGDDPFIQHEPILDSDPGPVIAAYSIAVLKTGEKSREVMSIAAIEKVRTRSKASKNGPWVTDYEEMCRKTVARRHSKVLPMSTDLDDLLRRDDDLYDFEAARADNAAGAPQTLAGKLDVLAALPATEAPSTATNGEEQANSAASTSAPANGAAEAGQAGLSGPYKASPAKDQASTQPLPNKETAATGQAASNPQGPSRQKDQGAATATDKTPQTEAEYRVFAEAWIKEATDSKKGEARWKSEKLMRREVHITQETFEYLDAFKNQKWAEIEDADRS
jgi:recombination protein RecT